MPRNEREILLDIHFGKKWREKQIEASEGNNDKKQHNRDIRIKKGDDTSHQTHHSKEKEIDIGNMDCDGYFSIENDHNSEPEREQGEIDHHENIDGIHSEKQCAHGENTQNHARYHRMSTEEDKSIGIFRISQEINTIDHARQEKDTIIEQSEINREPEDICYAESDSHESSVEENSRAQVEGLFKSITFRNLLFEKLRPTDDIERRNNLAHKNNPNHNNDRHLNISVKKEENNRKNTVYQAREK